MTKEISTVDTTKNAKKTPEKEQPWRELGLKEEITETLVPKVDTID
jgi:hypothetical protein